MTSQVLSDSDATAWGGDRYDLPSRGRRWCFALATVAACGVPLIFPGDAPWIGDEPWLIRNALLANEAGRLAELGLQGTRGFTYSPVATWFYQALLLVSHNAVHLVLMRAAVVTAVTAVSLAWLARTLRLYPWFAVTVLLSPYLWYFSRVLWDNSFNIPLSALAFAAYAHFLKMRASWALRLTVGCLVTMPLVHLMALAFVGPVAMHMLLCERRELWRHRFSLLLIVLAPFVVAWPYFSHLLTERPQTNDAPASLQAWLFSLWGARLISAKGLEIFMGADWFAAGEEWQRTVSTVAPVLSSIVLVLSWLGLMMAIHRLVMLRRQRLAMSTRDHVAALALGIWLAQTFLNGLSHAHGHVQYYNSTWMAYAILAWLAVNSVSWETMRTFVGLQALAVGAMLVCLIVRLHETGGTRAWQYGPTLANQMQVAAELLKFDPNSSWETDVANVRRFPYALQVLMKLNGTEYPEPRPRRSLRVQYTSKNPADAHIELVFGPAQ